MYFLFDYNLEEVVDASVMKSAKNMLNEYYSKLNGIALRRAFENGQINLYRLSQDQRQEMGL
jgi:hypothetical protein